MNYENYSLEELQQVKKDVNRELYPDRYLLIIKAIEEKANTPVHKNSPELVPLNDEQVVDVNIWLLRFLVVFGIGGAFSGISLIIPNIFTPQSVVNCMIYIIFFFINVFGIWSSIKLIESRTIINLEKCFVFWLVQIPIFMSPIIGYQFSNGLFINVWVSSNEGLKFVASMGSAFNFSIFQTYQPWAIGINLIAVIIAILIYSSIKAARKRLMHQ